MKAATLETANTCDCPKCGGTGYIPAFSGIANGDCFRCDGTGKVRASTVKTVVMPLAESVVRQMNWIMSATEEQICSMTWVQISKSRDLVHSSHPDMAPVRKVWFDRFNDHFCALQDIEWQKVNDRIQAGWAPKNR